MAQSAISSNRSAFELVDSASGHPFGGYDPRLAQYPEGRIPDLTGGTEAGGNDIPGRTFLSTVNSGADSAPSADVTTDLPNCHGMVNDSVRTPIAYRFGLR